MKINILILVGLQLISFISRGQVSSLPSPEPAVIECTYRLTYQSDSTDQYKRVEYMRLLIGKSISKFESKGTYLHDSLVNKEKDVPFTQVSAQAFADKFVKLPQSRFKYSIYKASALKKIYCYDRIANKLYRYEEPDDLFHWEITASKASIAGYSCQRATTVFAGRVYEAWFTREIPIAEGPYKFYGLPGLIVKINDSRNFYQFELIKLNKSQSFTISFPTENAIVASKKDIHKAQANYDFSLADRAAAISSKMTESEKKAIQERAKKRNNPLEIK